MTKNFQLEAVDTTGNTSARSNASVSTISYSQPAEIAFDINSVLQENVSSYSGNLQKIIDRMYFDLTGMNPSEMLGEQTDGGQSYLRIIFRNQGGAPAEFEPVIENNLISGGTVYINKSNLPLQEAVELAAKELYGAFHPFVIVKNGERFLATNDWTEGRSALYQKHFMLALQQNHGLDRSLKSLQTTISDMHAFADELPGTVDPAKQGLRALWARAYTDASLKEEIESSPQAELGLASILSLINSHNNSFDPTAPGPSFTPEAQEWTRQQLLRRPTDSGAQTALEISYLSP